MDEQPQGRLTRRRLLKGLGATGGVAGISYLAARRLLFENPDRPLVEAREAGRPDLDDLAANVVSGGPPKDGIPPIDDPRFVPARKADFLSDDDVVFGVVRGGEPRAYPQLILVWHEIVNDEFDDGPVSVTYCPLTGSVVGFRGTAADGRPYRFGTTGRLVNSNLLMYDRQTDSSWPQILGQAISGQAVGSALEEIPVEWTSWRRWRGAHPETVVLSTETGHLRSYGTDPYGSYTPLGGYYSSSSLIFRVMREDDRFPRKEVMIGAKHGPVRIAVRKQRLAELGALPAGDDAGPLVFLYDHDLDAGRAFLARDPPARTFSAGRERGRYTDAATGSIWDPLGRAIDGPLAGTVLTRVLSMDVMWFAWFAFFPDALVIE